MVGLLVFYTVNQSKVLYSRTESSESANAGVVALPTPHCAMRTRSIVHTEAYLKEEKMFLPYMSGSRVCSYPTTAHVHFT